MESENIKSHIFSAIFVIAVYALSQTGKNVSSSRLLASDLIKSIALASAGNLLILFLMVTRFSQISTQSIFINQILIISGTVFYGVVLRYLLSDFDLRWIYYSLINVLTVGLLFITLG